MARKRIDPVSRPADGRRADDHLRNADPNRHYVFANPNDEGTGVESYLSQGYEIEKRRPDGPRPLAGKTVGDGEAITVRGQILMSRPLDVHEAELAQGQAIADSWDRRIRKSGGLEGDARGPGFRIGIDRPNTSDSFVELEQGV